MRDMIELQASSSVTFSGMITTLCTLWLMEEPFDRGEVHAQETTEPEMVTRELTDVTLDVEVPNSVQLWQEMIKPNLPWAEDHFQERVSGEPLNPPPSERYWPYAQQGNAAHKKDELFSHSYPERFWPKRAGHLGQRLDFDRMGIRFPLGDLDDLIEVLRRNPRSRQAYLPVWFPEDLGAATQGERVPCTLGYHFMQHSDEKLYMSYPMRSCDMMRFLVDDIYMAGRLLQWVGGEVGMATGWLRMNISSLHAFEGDRPRIEQLASKDRRSHYNFEALG